MFKYFQTQLSKVKYNGEIIENATIVSVLATAKTDGNIPIPTQYIGCDIMGKLWNAETQEFYNVELIEEEEATAYELLEIMAKVGK